MKNLKKFVLVLFSVYIALIIAELIVRFAGLAPVIHRVRTHVEKSAYQASDNPVLGYEFKPNYRDDRPDLSETFPYINAHGQRDIERIIEKTPGLKRIIVLGDSVVAGHGLFDLDNTMTRQLEGMLISDKIEVLNFGIGGYCTRGEIEILKTKALKFDPDLVIVVFVKNDFRDFNSQVGHYRLSRPWPAEWFFIYSHLFRLAAMQLDWFEFSSETGDFFASKKQYVAMGGDNVKKGLKLLEQLSIIHDFDCFVAIWPRFDDNCIVDVDNGIKQPWFDGDHANISDPAQPMTVELITRQYGIPSFRLSQYFKRDYNKRLSQDPAFSIKNYTVEEDTHASVLGSKVAAVALKEIICANFMENLQACQ